MIFNPVGKGAAEIRKTLCLGHALPLGARLPKSREVNSLHTPHSSMTERVGEEYGRSMANSRAKIIY